MRRHHVANVLAEELFRRDEQVSWIFRLVVEITPSLFSRNIMSGAARRIARFRASLWRSASSGACAG